MDLQFTCTSEKSILINRISEKFKSFKLSLKINLKMAALEEESINSFNDENKRSELALTAGFETAFDNILNNVYRNIYLNLSQFLNSSLNNLVKIYIHNNTKK